MRRRCIHRGHHHYTHKEGSSAAAAGAPSQHTARTTDTGGNTAAAVAECHAAATRGLTRETHHGTQSPDEQYGPVQCSGRQSAVWGQSNPARPSQSETIDSEAPQGRPLAAGPFSSGWHRGKDPRVSARTNRSPITGLAHCSLLDLHSAIPHVGGKRPRTLSPALLELQRALRRAFPPPILRLPDRPIRRASGQVGCDARYAGR